MIVSSLRSQQKQGEVLPSAKTRVGLKEKQVGTTIMHVDYAMNADTIGLEWTYIDLQLVRIEPSISNVQKITSAILLQIFELYWGQRIYLVGSAFLSHDSAVFKRA